ncbi:MAG: hypothetical protein Q4D29_01550 [Lachnospiraceae bacterium]|nr:hypothetical protein [Lachnospiraceae bacterium]
MGVKSLICPIEGNSWDVERALNEVDGFSRYQGLGAKQSENLRLIGEELLGMIGGFLDIENGRFWIEVDGDEYSVNLAAKSILGTRAKSILDSTSKNMEYKGIGGIVRKAIDGMSQMFRDSGAAYNFTEQIDAALAGTEIESDDALQWSLDSYNKSIERDEKAEEWDELELSVLKKFSKNIIVSYRNDRVDIKVIADI